MKQAKKNHGLARRQLKSLLSGLLVFVMIFGMIPALPTTAGAAVVPVTIDEALEKVADWGVMTGGRPNDGITRAEFVAMVNRAFGYTEMGETPFTDISPRSWYYEDICIAYNMGYLKGTNTEGTLASPNDPLPREQAAVLIARNLCLEESVGEVTAFPDSREFSSWSAHHIEALAEEGIVGGDEKGNFNAKNNIKRGEVAVMLVRAIGTLVQEPGEYSLGGVYRNLTISSPGVTLKDTTVVGDLYITGGLGLGDVTLENVTVLGKIVVAGAGEAEAGEHSVTLRNVAAEELVVDSIANQLVTLKAQGLTNIDAVDVRTTAYLEDLTEDGLGLKNIELDGDAGTAFYLAGNIKNATNLTPNSTLYMAQGIAAVVTIDEAATGATLDIANKAIVSDLNLDAGTIVTGSGDISHVNVNAAGSSISMLPDTITVRPGITADVNGETMDTTAAAESSEDPRILSGYPAAKDVASTTATAGFRTNKKGTLYWAVTALTDGSLEEADLIDSSTSSGKILQRGTISVTASNTEFTAKLTGLTKDGSYYVSAVLVDNRGMSSPVKVTAFTTPDDTVPAFTTGYPYTIIADGDDDEQIVQVMAMTNKNCLMYYALYPKGSAAPTAADFKANALSGNLGHGVVEMTKNTPQLVPRVNNSYLQEETEYDLYVWLTDADGSKSSAVRKLPVKTLDRTSPTITSLRVESVAADKVTLSFTLDEPGTFYWSVVKYGADFYEKGVSPGTEEGNIQIMSGIGALQNGSQKASKADTKVTFTISKLEAQTAYHVHYVAVDNAGNYSVYNTSVIPNPYEIHTKDEVPPTVRQEFTHDDSGGVTPYPDTSIRLVFSEKVQGIADWHPEDGDTDYMDLLALYEAMRSGETYDNQEVKAEYFAEVLSSYIEFYQVGSNDPAPQRTEKNEDDWVIDYRKARIEPDPNGTGELIVIFPYSSDSDKSALNLAGGATYYFALTSLADTSDSKNPMGAVTLPAFTTVSAQINLTRDYAEPTEQYTDSSGTKVNFGFTDFDMTFRAEPLSHTSMDKNMLWDLIFWTDSMISFELYESINDGESWTKVGGTASIGTGDGAYLGISIGDTLRGGNWQTLNELEERVYGIRLTLLDEEPKRDTWSSPVTIRVTAISGSKFDLGEVSSALTSRASYDEIMKIGVSDITKPVNPEVFEVTHTFTDNTSPQFADDYPTFIPGDSSVRINVMLDRPNSYYYYVVAKVGNMSTTLSDSSSTKITSSNWSTTKDLIPTSGEGLDTGKTDTDGNKIYELMTVSAPSSSQVQRSSTTTNPSYKGGEGAFTGPLATFTVTGLEANTDYLVYFVLRGESTQSVSAEPYVFRFSTGDVETPTVYLKNTTPSVYYETSTEANMTWMMLTDAALNGMTDFTADFYNQVGVNRNNEADVVAIEDALYAVSDPDVKVDGVLTEKEIQAYFKLKWKDYFNTSTLVDENKDKTIAYDEVRVIDALVASMSNSDLRSVFDYYAGASLYKTISEDITVSTGGTDRIYGEERNTTGDSLDFTGGTIKTGVDYYFIAAARNSQGSTYGFKAISNFRLIDSDPPTLNGNPIVSWTAWKDEKETTKSKPGDESIDHFSGTITLVFTDTPYFRATAAGSLPEKLTGNIKNKMTVSGFDTMKATISGSTITISFTVSTSRASVIIFNNGYISDSYGYHIESQLIFQFGDLPMMWPDNTTLTLPWTCTWGSYSWSSGN